MRRLETLHILQAAMAGGGAAMFQALGVDAATAQAMAEAMGFGEPPPPGGGGAEGAPGGTFLMRPISR